MITDLLNSMGTPGLICTVAALAFVFYCIIKGGKGNGGGRSGNGGSTKHGTAYGCDCITEKTLLCIWNISIFI